MLFIPIMQMLGLLERGKEQTALCQTKIPTELFPLGSMTFAVACAHCKNVGSDICRLCKMEKVSGFELKTKKTAKVRRIKL